MDLKLRFIKLKTILKLKYKKLKLVYPKKNYKTIRTSIIKTIKTLNPSFPLFLSRRHQKPSYCSLFPHQIVAINAEFTIAPMPESRQPTASPAPQTPAIFQRALALLVALLVTHYSCWFLLLVAPVAAPGQLAARAACDAGGTHYCCAWLLAVCIVRHRALVVVGSWLPLKFSVFFNL